MLRNDVFNPLSSFDSQRVRPTLNMLNLSNKTLEPLSFDYTHFNKRNTKQSNATKGLSIGESVSNITVIDHVGRKQELYELLTRGKVIVIFYRGQWCPFCIPFLRKIQKELLQIYSRGTSVLLVTPEKQEKIQITHSKTDTTIPIIHDKDYKLMDLFDVSFVPNRIEKFVCNIMLGAGLKKAHSDKSQTLPIPATFIIDQNRTVKWRHFDKNFKIRANIKEIIKNI